MNKKKRLGEMLIESGLIDESQLHAALGHQRRWGGKLGKTLVDLRLVKPEEIIEALSKKLGYPIVDVARLKLTPAIDTALNLVPAEFALENLLLPIAADSHSLTIAMADPTNIAVIDDLSFRTGRRIRVALAWDRDIEEAARRLYYPMDDKEHVSAVALRDAPSDIPLLEGSADPFASRPDVTPPSQLRSNQPPSALGTIRSVPRQPLDAGTPHDAPPNLLTPVISSPRSLAPGTSPQVPTMPARVAFAAAAPTLDTHEEPIVELTQVELTPVDEAPPQNPMEAMLRDLLRHMADGQPSAVIQVGQLAAALALLLLEKRIITTADLLRALGKR